MRKLTLVTLGFFLLALIPHGGLARQDDFMPCFGLSADDCELYYDGNNPFTSAYFTYDLMLYAADADETAEVTSQGSGSFTVNLEASSFSKAIECNLEMEITSGGQTVPLELRFIDGMFYIGSQGRWWYMTFAEVMKLSGAPIELDKLISPADMLPSGETDDAAALADADISKMMAQLSPFFEVLSEYIVATRGENIDIKGNPVSVFTTKIDIKGLVSDPDISKSMNDLLTEIPNEIANSDVAWADIVDGMQMLPVMLPMFGLMVKDAEATLYNKIGVGDRYNYGVGIDLDLVLNPAMLGMVGSESKSKEPIDLVIEFTIDFTDHNAGFTYEIPEGAQELVIEQ